MKLLILTGENNGTFTTAALNPANIVSITGTTNAIIHTNSTVITVTGETPKKVIAAINDAVRDLNRDVQAISVEVFVGTAVAGVAIS
jgi:hypothetical protein